MRIYVIIFIWVATFEIQKSSFLKVTDADSHTTVIQHDQVYSVRNIFGYKNKLFHKPLSHLANPLSALSKFACALSKCTC
jgi:hypothetical protein